MDKLRRFLNNTPPEYIQRFLKSFSRIGWEDIDWTAKPRSRTDQLERAVRNTTEKIEPLITATIEQIEKIADETGRRSLRDVLDPEEHDLEAFDQLPDPRACAIWVLQISTDLFERALEIDYASRKRTPKFWSGFILDGNPPLPEAFDGRRHVEFETDVQNIFASSAGLRGSSHIEWFRRMTTDPLTGERHWCVQATMYQEGTPRSEPVISEPKGLEHVIRAPLIEGAIVFDGEAGTIDVVARGGKRVHRKIAESFGSRILDLDSDMRLLETRALDLTKLARDRPLEIRAEDGIDGVEVSMLRLASTSGDPMMLTIETGSAGIIDEGDIYERMRREFGSPELSSRPSWRIVKAELRFTLTPKAGRSRGKILRVQLSLPNRTNLRQNTEIERRIAEKLLERWGLYEPTAKSDAAA